MSRRTIRLAIAAGLIGLGWAAGKAQTGQPDFELIVDSPTGETSVTCVRGCEMAWVERGFDPDPAIKLIPTFTFKCSNSLGLRCSSGKIGGWIKR
jgi:hypothetical protein